MKAREKNAKSYGARSKTAQDSTLGRPLTVDALRELGALSNIGLPGGPFDPNGAWEQTWQIWLVSFSWKGMAGYLSLKRAPAQNGEAIVLNVEMAVMQTARSVHVTRADTLCAADPLASPRSWRIESEIRSPDGKAIEVARVEEKAEVKDGVIEVAAGQKTFTRKVPKTFTSNWSVFDAVQRLPFANSKPLEFALLEDLDLLKEGHRLSRWKDRAAVLSGKEIAVHGFQHIGAGILPYQYWLDEQHRLVVALSGIRAYIVDADAKNRFDQSLRQGSQPGKGTKA